MVLCVSDLCLYQAVSGGIKLYNAGNNLIFIKCLYFKFLTHNPLVVGSKPTRPTRFYPSKQPFRRFFFYGFLLSYFGCVQFVSNISLCSSKCLDTSQLTYRFNQKQPALSF